MTTGNKDMLYELIDHELVDVINDNTYQWQDAVRKLPPT
ncbi:hypothetical protein JCM19237_2434 [Photobacterium aphoticum]|uniref:Uncharacterized protein n=1 Tax=Photobacterium aphoticum TaxID=754436 RepID=A0A090QPU4_9GAMM|nr:hypothetical protein JCM19237_2434 [Photobacterium aphoticum]